MQQKEKVHFQSEGLKVVGNLFRPQNSKGEDVSLPVILIAGAITGVKEQIAGQYAEHIAKNGYVTLVLDHRHFGESEGEPRQHEDPAKKLEDFKNAISFLSSLIGIDRERIGACGISMGGGYMLQLAAFDRRIKAVSIVAPGLNLADTLLEMLGNEGFVNFLKGLSHPLTHTDVDWAVSFEQNIFEHKKYLKISTSMNKV
jgi:dienelactone hydrolase